MRKVSKREERFLNELWELRYLSSSQIQQLWYPGRSIENCRVRLSRLAKDGFIQRQPLYDDLFRFAWCLGSMGYAHLRRRCGGEYQAYDVVSPVYIPQWIETNDLYVTLRGNNDGIWDDLPFLWRGSHRSVLRYCTRLDGGLSRIRDREVRPDAIVETQGTSLCVFVELDRCTESLVSGTGRRSIEGKLDAYAQYLNGRTYSGATWFEKQYGAERKARIVFVVPGRGKSTERIDNIRAMAHAHPVSKVASLVCLSSTERGAIRKACGLPEEMPTTQTSVTSDLALWRKLYEVSAQAYRRLSPESPIRPKFLHIVQQTEARLLVLETSCEGGIVS
jgi:hypothetical protein